MLNTILHRVLNVQKIFWLVLILFSSQLFGQSVFLDSPPYGDDISAESYASRNKGDYKVVVGKRFINFSLKGKGYGGGDEWHSSVSPIMSAGFKKGSDDTYFVLLEDGTVDKLTVTSGLDWVHIWSVSLSGPMSSGSVDFDKIVGDALYVLSTAGLFVTRDNGVSWQKDMTGLGSANVSDIALDSLQNVYAATDNGLYFQGPKSNSWQQITSSTFGFISGFKKVFVDRKNRIFVGVSDGGIFMSTDNGSTWSADNTGIDASYKIVNSFGDDAFGNAYVVVSGLLIPNAIFKSTGGTSSWTRIDAGITAITVNQPVINSIGGDSTLYAGTSFGLYSSTDKGATWMETNTGIPAETFNGIVKTQNGRLIVSTALAIYTKDVNDNSWTKRFPIKGYEANLPLYKDGLGNLYTTEQGKYSLGKIIKSTDNGTTWGYDTLGLGSLKNPQLFCVDQNGNQYLTGSIPTGNTSKIVVYQKQLGGSWVQDLSGALANVGFPNTIASDQHGWLYMSVYWNNTISSQTQGVVRKSINGGVWTIDSTGIPPNFTFFYKMLADKNGMMYGHNYFNLLRRTNTGWVNVPGPQQIPGTYFTAFSFDSSNTLFAALKTYSYSTGRSFGKGVYFTTDQGVSWKYAGLDSLIVNQLLSYGNKTYAITDRGIFVIARNGATAVKEQNQIPLQYELSQNYPNPFNPSTVIGYRIPVAGHVSLKIYEILGREVTTLVDKEESAGNYKVTFDGSRFASGVYFYRLTAGDFVQTRKLILQK